ncbi:MAG: hypothetical protein AAF355_10620 [Myxococcota bacterium]
MRLRPSGQVRQVAAQPIVQGFSIETQEAYVATRRSYGVKEVGPSPLGPGDAEPGDALTE